MENILEMEQQQQIQAPVALGWSDRRIGQETGLDRGTVSKYRKKNQIPPEVSTDSAGQNKPNVPTDSECPNLYVN